MFILPIPAIGVPELLGGFATGLALSRRFFIPFGVALRADPGFSSHVHDQMKPIIHLFTPVFFVTVGLSLDRVKLRSLKLPVVTLYGVGAILGTGTYVLIGEVAAAWS